MSFFVALIEQYRLLAVFGCVFIAQLGIPVPAYPTLIIAGALLQHASYTSGQLLLVSVSAALLADIGWYAGGRRTVRRLWRNSAVFRCPQTHACVKQPRCTPGGELLPCS